MGGRFCLLFSLGVAAGCGSAAPAPSKIGAEEAARAFHEALIARDWTKAYSQLAPETQKVFSGEQFGRLARDYRQQLGFEPAKVQVRSCEERETEATAHITVRGASIKHRFRDAVLLKQLDDQWWVVLPKNFGQANRK